MDNLFKIINREGPIISVALHDGHLVEEVILQHMNLQEHERFREEDPYTAFIANQETTIVKVNASRFMLDLNRPIEKSVYLNKEDAWGLEVWKIPLPEDILIKLRKNYQDFYHDITLLIEEKLEKYGYFFILDIHSYNHRRTHPKEMAPIEENPEINLGTAYNDPKWRTLMEKFQGYLSNCKIAGKTPDVRENIKFKGGGFAQWVCNNYGEHGGIISVEFKKTFMDEWTGKANIEHIQDLKESIKGSIPMILSELETIKKHQKEYDGNA